MGLLGKGRRILAFPLNEKESHGRVLSRGVKALTLAGVLGIDFEGIRKGAGSPLRRPHTVLIQCGSDEGDKKWFPFCMFQRQSQQNFLTEYM